MLCSYSRIDKEDINESLEFFRRIPVESDWLAFDQVNELADEGVENVGSFLYTVSDFIA